jgi:Flp pilus assembly protein TadG
MMRATTSRARQGGAALVELALLLMPLIVMVFGVTELGRAIYQYNTLVKATRDAVRYLSTQAPGNNNNEYRVAQCLAVYGKQSCSAADTPLLPGLATTMVTICDSTSAAPTSACPLSYGGVPTGSGAVNLTAVSITGFAFSPLVLSPLTPFSGSITFGPISATMRQT